MDASATEAFLAERMPLGREFLKQEVKTRDDLERFDEQVHRWSQYNQEWLRINIGTSEAYDYGFAAVHVTLDPGISVSILVDSYRTSILAQIRQLESIEARLPLWAAQQRAAAQRAAEQRAAKQLADEQRAAEQLAAEQLAAEQLAAERVQPSPNAPVFIVHGRDTNRAQLVARAVERATGREVIILREQPSGGRTLIEKFEGNAQGASYAIVLITADDQGGPKDGPSQSRGRQNVIFEMGYFYGKIGRNRVCVLLDTDVEQPSDMSGIVYIDFGNEGVWKQELFREMHHAGFNINWSRIPS